MFCVSRSGWWFVDLDSEVGWVPASYLEPRDGSMDDQVLETFQEGEGRMNTSIFVNTTQVMPETCSMRQPSPKGGLLARKP